MTTTETTTPPRAALMLVLATVGFAINFWAWALLSPLSSTFQKNLDLTSFQTSLVVAVPVIIGSLGRIPVGALTDRVGARIMFPAVSALTILPVLFLGLVGTKSFGALIVGGLFLGIAGTAFAVGVPFVNGWYPPSRRGLAIGIFGVGMGGTAIAALTTIPLVENIGPKAPFLITAAALAGYALIAWFLLRAPAGWLPSTQSLAKRLGQTMRIRVTWDAALLYATTFGGYVAFSVYLVSYLGSAYDLERADASARMAGFVLVAVVMRPVGGWLSDRVGPTIVLMVVFAVIVVDAAIQAFTPPLMPLGTITFLTMAAVLGAGSGATFAFVARLAPPGYVGSVTGFVGAAGGLGGFFPPLVMGATFGAFGSFAFGLGLLAVVAVGMFVFTATRVRSAMAQGPQPLPASPAAES